MLREEVNQNLNKIAEKYDFDYSSIKTVFGQLHDYHKQNFYLLFDEWIEPLQKSLSFQTAEGFYLESGACSWNGILRNPACEAQGVMRLHATKSFNLPEETIFYSKAGVEFKTLETTWIEEPSTLVKIKAIKEGKSSNLQNGTTLYTDRSFSGLDYATLPNDWIKEEGKELETDSQLRERILERLAQDTTGDIAIKFISFAKTVEGVRDVTIWRVPRGAGSMNVVLASRDGTVTLEMIEEVKAILEDKFIIAWDIEIIESKKQVMDILVKNNSSFEEEAIKEMIQQYILTLPIHGIFSLKDLYEKLPTSVNILSPLEDRQAELHSEWQGNISFRKED